MSLLNAVIFGVIQGLTEFLPISSDGHLVIFERFFHWTLVGRDALGFDVLLHGASLLALVILYGRTWMRLLAAPFTGDLDGTRVLLLLILSAVPGAIAGLLLGDVIALQLRSLTAAAIGFLITAFVLIIGERVGARRAHAQTREHLTVVQVIFLGIAQAIAILPGVSRSGLTISTGRLLGMSRREAVDFSFLMAAPIIAGAVGKTLLDAWSGTILFPPFPVAFVAFVTTFIVSMLAIIILRSFVRSFSLAWFAVYLIPLALFLLLLDLGALHWIGNPHVLSHLIRRYGALVIFLICFLEVIPPISFISPGVLLLVIAGAMAPTPGIMLFFIIAAACGMMLGNAVIFRLGYFFGRGLAHHFHLTEDRLKAVDATMRRFGAANVFIGQFIGLVRPAIAFVAGATRMPVLRYYLWMIASSIAWGASYVCLGYFLRGNVPWLLSSLAGVGILLYLLSFLAVGAEMYAARGTTTQHK